MIKYSHIVASVSLSRQLSEQELHCLWTDSGQCKWCWLLISLLWLWSTFQFWVPQFPLAGQTAWAGHSSASIKDMKRMPKHSSGTGSQSVLHPITATGGLPCQQCINTTPSRLESQPRSLLNAEPSHSQSQWQKSFIYGFWKYRIEIRITWAGRL